MHPTATFEVGSVEATLIANAGEAVIVADVDGVIRFWNPAAERMFGYSREEAIGAPLDIIVPENLRSAHWDGYRRVMATGKTKYVGQTLSVPAIRSDGQRISVSFTVSLLTAANGNVLGIGAIIRDVTAEWEKQRATRRRLAELEREIEVLRADSAA
jgi:PAS domain S-box-containing protein